jgi:SAM-dependent methyltransferase
MTFDHYAADYDAHLNRGIGVSGEGKEFFAAGRLEAARAFLEAAQIAPRRILEFGCGTGTNLGLMREMWPDSELVGIDDSEASLVIGRERWAGARIQFLQVSELVSRSPAPFDWAFCNGVFHHIPHDQHPRIIGLIRSLLRPGGAFTLFDNNPFNLGAHIVMRRIPFDRDAHMINPYRLRSRVAALGFDSVSCRFLFIFPKLLAPLRRIEPPLSGLPLGAQYGILALRAGQGLGAPSAS